MKLLKYSCLFMTLTLVACTTMPVGNTGYKKTSSPSRSEFGAFREIIEWNDPFEKVQGIAQDVVYENLWPFFNGSTGMVVAFITVYDEARSQVIRYIVINVSNRNMDAVGITTTELLVDSNYSQMEATKIADFTGSIPSRFTIPVKDEKYRFVLNESTHKKLDGANDVYLKIHSKLGDILYKLSDNDLDHLKQYIDKLKERRLY